MLQVIQSRLVLSQCQWCMGFGFCKLMNAHVEPANWRFAAVCLHSSTFGATLLGQFRPVLSLLLCRGTQQSFFQGRWTCAKNRRGQGFGFHEVDPLLVRLTAIHDGFMIDFVCMRKHASQQENETHETRQRYSVDWLHCWITRASWHQSSRYLNLQNRSWGNSHRVLAKCEIKWQHWRIWRSCLFNPSKSSNFTAHTQRQWIKN